jgi:hypothetical protein
MLTGDGSSVLVGYWVGDPCAVGEASDEGFDPPGGIPPTYPMTISVIAAAMRETTAPKPMATGKLDLGVLVGSRPRVGAIARRV